MCVNLMINWAYYEERWNFGCFYCIWIKKKIYRRQCIDKMLIANAVTAHTHCDCLHFIDTQFSQLPHYCCKRQINQFESQTHSFVHQFITVKQRNWKCFTRFYTKSNNESDSAPFCTINIFVCTLVNECFPH